MEKAQYSVLFNRMNDFIVNANTSGQVLYHDHNIYDPDVDPVQVRQKIGMVFQKPNPFPKSIYDNVAWGAKINKSKENIDELVEECLIKAALWNEVKDHVAKIRVISFRRATAKTMHCTNSGGKARNHTNGRAMFCFGPNCDIENRGLDEGIIPRIYHHYRDA